MGTVFIIVLGVCLAAHGQPLQGPFEVLNLSEGSLVNLQAGARSDSVGDLFWQSGDSIYHGAAILANGEVFSGWNAFAPCDSGWHRQLCCVTEADTYWAAVVYDTTATLNRTRVYTGHNTPGQAMVVDSGMLMGGDDWCMIDVNYAFACGRVLSGTVAVVCQDWWAVGGLWFPFWEAGFGVKVFLPFGDGAPSIYVNYGSPFGGFWDGTLTEILPVSADTLLVMTCSPYEAQMHSLNCPEPRYCGMLNLVGYLGCDMEPVHTMRTSGGRLLVLSRSASGSYPARLLEITGLQSCVPLMELDADPLAACSHPDYGMAWLSRFGHGLVLYRVDTLGSELFPPGALEWPEADHDILGAALSISDEGTLVALWSERIVPSSDATVLKMASVGWDTPLATHEKPRSPAPASLELSSYPNPFNATALIRFSLPKAGEVKLVVFDALGRQAAVLADEMRQAGSYSVAFDGRGLPSGIYFARIETNAGNRTQKMMLLK